MSPSKVGFDYLSLNMYLDLGERMGNVKFVESDIVRKMGMIKDTEEIERKTNQRTRGHRYGGDEELSQKGNKGK